MASRILAMIRQRVETYAMGYLYTKIPALHLFIYGAHLTPKAKLVFMALRATDFDFEWTKDEVNQISYETLATLTGYHKDTVRLAIMELKTFGWIKVVAGEMNANYYYTRDCYPKDDAGNQIVCPTKEQAKAYSKLNKKEANVPF
jgi:hypothetical protein